MEPLVNFIIRPPRAEYSPDHDLLDQEFMLKGKWYQRKDIEVENSRGDTLQCSHYMPLVRPEGKALPCVIYCHGNSGCRADASEAAIILLPSNITVFTLDFSGSGLSGGEHVTLGWYEKEDLKTVVDYLRADENVSMIGLWGRSMGAVTSLMYGAADPSIAGMVLDSPFSDLVELMMELVDTYKFRFPKFTVKFAIQFMRKAIQKKAKFDIMDLNTIKVASCCFVPVLFGHANDDDFIHPHHSERIYEAYVGDKNIIKFEGDHNSPRPQFYFDSINIFFHNVLQPPEDEGNWSTAGYLPEPSTVSRGLATSSTTDAINQVRSKRPMSRTEVPSEVPSKDCQSEAKENSDDDDSSSMISFELSNGQPYNPHVPTAVIDDQYVEYQLDDLAGFPCNVEEEERMLMEAVLESLKDMEMRKPQTEEQEPSKPSISADRSESSEKGKPSASSTSDHSTVLGTESVSTADVNIPPRETDSTTINSQNVALKQHIYPKAPFDTPGSVLESTSTITSSSSSRSNTSTSICSSSDVTDMSDKTKATVTVERNPSNNVMEGLWRRWDLNFFKNR